MDPQYDGVTCSGGEKNCDRLAFNVTNFYDLISSLPGR